MVSLPIAVVLTLRTNDQRQRPTLRLLLLTNESEFAGDHLFLSARKMRSRFSDYAQMVKIDGSGASAPAAMAPNFPVYEKLCSLLV